MKTRNLFLISLFLFFSFQANAAQEKPYSSSYYERLGLTSSATPEEIKNAYRQLMMKYHPDRNTNVDPAISQNINIAYEYLSSGKGKAGIETGSSKTYNSNNNYEVPPRDKVIEELYAFYTNNRTNKVDELRILYHVFAMDKYDIEFMIRNSNFSKITGKLFSSSLWSETDNRLLEIFVRGWGLYSFRTSTDNLVQLLSQLNPDDPRLRKIIYEYDFPSVGSDFKSWHDRKSWLMLVNAKMLALDKYRGTAAGEKLLAYNYAMWQSLKAGEDLSPYSRDLWALDILGLLEMPEYANHPYVLEMVREIPELLHKHILGRGGVFSDQNAQDLYRATLKKYPRIFEGAVVNSPIDDLIWFYNDLTLEERDAQKDTELKILTRAFRLGKYDFEALMKDKAFSGILEKSFARPIWQDPSNGLFNLFINGSGFFGLIYRSELIGSLFGRLDPDDRNLKKIIYDVNFGSFQSPGSDYSSLDKRLDFIKPILTQMLTQKPYQNTEAGQNLKKYIDRLWKDLKRKYGSLSYMEDLWVISLLKLMDNDIIRKDPTMIEIYRSIPELVNSGKAELKYTSEKELYQKQREKYKYIFESKGHPTEPPSAVLCRSLF